ncbi:MAG: YdhR family protein [Archangiaceae bacterium]|nr:YdhR family protein [Archangiaceae bacterium]
MRAFSLLLLAACSAVKPIPTTPEVPMSLPAPQSNAVVIVRVPSPWWAPNFLITGKFIDSIPEYAKAPGLLHKSYTFSERREFGGVYLWESRQAAEAWFDEAWHERVRQQRGVEGDVRMLDAKYTVPGAATFSGKELPQHGLRTDAVITWVSSEPSVDASKLEPLATVLPAAQGLVRVSFGTERDGRLGVVSVWSSSAAAQAYWTAERRAAVSSVIGAHTLSTFDAPVVLDAALAKKDSP